MAHLPQTLKNVWHQCRQYKCEQSLSCLLQTKQKQMTKHKQTKKTKIQTQKQKTKSIHKHFKQT